MPRSTRNPKILHYTQTKEISSIQNKLTLINELEIDVELFKQEKLGITQGNVNATTDVLNEYQVAENSITSVLDSSKSSLQLFINSSLTNPNIAPDQGGGGGTPFVQTPLITDKPLSDIHIGDDTLVIVATKSRGIARGNLPVTTDFVFTDDSPELSVPNRTTVILPIDTNILLIGTNGGLIQYTRSPVNINTTLANGLVSDSVLSMLKVGGAVIVGTDKGISITRSLGSLTFGSYDTHQTLSNIPITSLFEHNSILYIGTSNGVYTKDMSLDENSILYNNEINTNLISTYINSFGYTVANDTFYIGTDTGLLCIRNFSTTPTYELKNGYNGLGSSTVHSIATDESTIYVGTNNGISYSSDGGLTFSFITKSDGLAGYTCLNLKPVYTMGVITSITIIHSIGLTYDFNVSAL